MSAWAEELRAGLSGSLRRHVEAIQGPREHRHTPEALVRCESYVANQLEEIGLAVRRESFSYRGRAFANVVGSLGPARGANPVASDALLKGRATGRKRLLLGAHLDTVPASPGADDNGSGLAGLIEAARRLKADPLPCPVDFAAFHLEEFQKTTYRVGSRRFMAQARRDQRIYGGALLYDMIGYRSSEPGSQRVPRVLRWKGIPTIGDFIAVVGDRSARFLVDGFSDAGLAAGVPVVPLVVPAKGWIVLVTRRSDNASFWDASVPAVLISDTANLRNPNYHRPSDTSATLDYDFMARVVEATVGTMRRAADVLTLPSAGPS